MAPKVGKASTDRKDPRDTKGSGNANNAQDQKGRKGSGASKDLLATKGSKQPEDAEDPNEVKAVPRQGVETQLESARYLQWTNSRLVVSLSEKLSRVGAQDADWDEIAVAMDPQMNGDGIREHISALKSRLDQQSAPASARTDRHPTQPQPRPSSTTKERGAAAGSMVEDDSLASEQPSSKRHSISKAGEPFFTLPQGLRTRNAETAQPASAELTAERRSTIQRGLDAQGGVAQGMSRDLQLRQPPQQQLQGLPQMGHSYQPSMSNPAYGSSMQQQYGYQPFIPQQPSSNWGYGAPTNLTYTAQDPFEAMLQQGQPQMYQQPQFQPYHSQHPRSTFGYQPNPAYGQFPGGSMTTNFQGYPRTTFNQPTEHAYGFGPIRSQSGATSGNDYNVNPQDLVQQAPQAHAGATILAADPRAQGQSQAEAGEEEQEE